MSHEGRRSDAPTSAAGDSIILHVPACVQRFSSRRRILSRLRALARRRGRGLPELEAAPVKLQVEENPNWPAADQPPPIGLAIEGPEWREEETIGFDFQEDPESTPSAPASQTDPAPPPAAPIPREELQNP